MEITQHILKFFFFILLEGPSSSDTSNIRKQSQDSGAMANEVTLTSPIIIMHRQSGYFWLVIRVFIIKRGKRAENKGSRRDGYVYSSELIKRPHSTIKKYV